ncbi:hypothetical protein GCM10009551_081490 [Nocardiopsis tropica]
MSGLLETAQREQLDEVAGVQRRCGRIEPGIERDRPRSLALAERLDVGGLRDQAAPGQFLEDVCTPPSIVDDR